MFSIKHAVAGGGWLLAATIGALGFLGGDATDAGLVDHVVESITVSSPCPDGWGFLPLNTADAVVRSCVKDGWHVILGVDDIFDHGVREGDPGNFIFEPGGVPGWPQ